MGEYECSEWTDPSVSRRYAPVRSSPSDDRSSPPLPSTDWENMTQSTEHIVDNKQHTKNTKLKSDMVPNETSCLGWDLNTQHTGF